MSDGIQINLVGCTLVICNEIAHRLRQRDIALSYAMAIKSEAQGADRPNWSEINSAITSKWGLRGLVRVKNRAWRILDGAKP